MVLFAVPVCPGSIPRISLCLYMQKTPAERGGRCKLSIWSSRRCFSSWHQPGGEVSSELGGQRVAWLMVQGFGGEANPEEPHCLILTLILLSPLKHPWGARGGCVHSISPQASAHRVSRQSIWHFSVTKGRLESSLLIPCFLNP